jgi:hypothetical protein
MRRASSLIFLIACMSGVLPCPALAQDTNEIPPLRPPIREMRPGFWETNRTKVLLGAFGASVLLGGAVAAWVLCRPKPTALPPEEAARAELVSLKGKPQDSDTLSRVSALLRRGLAHVLNLPAYEMTTAEFSAALDGRQSPEPELDAKVKDFLRRCDQRKFDPLAPAQEWDAADEALVFLKTAIHHKRQLENRGA